MKNNKSKMSVLRIDNCKNITIAVVFHYNSIKQNQKFKAMLLEVASLENGAGNLGFIGRDADSVFFRFEKDGLKNKYTSLEREKYIGLLCKLQRYAQSHNCTVKFETV